MALHQRGVVPLRELFQGSEFQHEPSLIDAFCLTPEFVAVETLFSRADLPVSKKELIAMLKEGDWKMLHTFSEQQQMSQDLSPSRRQRFLLDYIVHQSSTAANLLLQQDGAFAAKQLDDPMVVTLLKALTTKTPEAEKYALEMLPARAATPSGSRPLLGCSTLPGWLPL